MCDPVVLDSYHRGPRGFRGEMTFRDGCKGQRVCIDKGCVLIRSVEYSNCRRTKVEVCMMVIQQSIFPLSSVEYRRAHIPCIQTMSWR